MGSSILAFRPASVIERLAPRNEACPLSLGDLLPVALPFPVTLPIVHAPLPGVACAALLAAKHAASVLGLALPPGTAPEAWFAAVASTADEIAPGLPIFLCAEVTVEGEDEAEVERAFTEAYRLLDGGITHLAIDAGAVAPRERARAITEVAAAAVERGVCIDCVLPDLCDARGAVALWTELRRRGLVPDVASVRCPAPSGDDEVRAQLDRIVEIGSVLGGTPVLRRGPTTPALLARIGGSPVRACDDGGAAAATALRALPAALAEAASPPNRLPRERAPGMILASRIREVQSLPTNVVDRFEALAYFETAAFVEALRSRGSALVVTSMLERRLAER